MIPFEEYVFDISFSLFSLRQLKASWWLELVKFSFTNILVFDIPILDPSKFLNVFLLYRIYLQYVRFTNLTIVFFELLFDFPMPWQSSILLWEIWLSAPLNTSITQCSRFLSAILSGIPVISILFLRSYCSTEFVAVLQ